MQIAYDTARGCGLQPDDARELTGRIWSNLRSQPLPNGAISIGALKGLVRHEAELLTGYDPLLDELSQPPG
jgi:hypothetical protein